MMRSVHSGDRTPLNSCPASSWPSWHPVILRHHSGHDDSQVHLLGSRVIEGNNLPSKEFTEDLFVWCYFLYVELANHLGCCEWTKFVQYFLSWIQYPWRRSPDDRLSPQRQCQYCQCPIRPAAAYPSTLQPGPVSGRCSMQAAMVISPSFPPRLPCPLNSKHG